jgi:hypothetical protein
VLGQAVNLKRSKGTREKITSPSAEATRNARSAHHHGQRAIVLPLLLLDSLTKRMRMVDTLAKDSTVGKVDMLRTV